MRIGYVGVVAVLSAGCNRYDLFRVAGYEQVGFSNKADILFVIDNSDSMQEESGSLAVNFSGFLGKIDTFEQTLSYQGLPDAVTNFVDYVQNRSAYLDYQFAITTTDVTVDGGLLLSNPVARGEEEVANRFIETLACESTCFPAGTAVPSDPDYTCGAELDTYVSEEFLTCACNGDWTGHCGSANEAGIEAVFLAMCRAVPNPPVECFADVDNGVDEPIGAFIDEGDTLSNEGMLRPNANFIPVIVSDEGDGSLRMPDGEERAEVYTELFSKFRTRMSWVLIGPGLDSDNKVECAGTGSDWGVVRYNYMVYTTDGLSIDIYENGCNEDPDFEAALEQFASLLTNLLTSFPLQSVPVPDTIIVLVDGTSVIEAEITGQDLFGFDEYSDGWTYRSSDNSIEFHGAAVPPYDASVEVYYLPVDGMPRELPF